LLSSYYREKQKRWLAFACRWLDAAADLKSWLQSRLPIPPTERQDTLYNLAPMRKLMLFALLLAACSPQAAATVAPLPTAQVKAITPAVLPTLPFAAATYRDEQAGLELQYPAAWFLVGGEAQSRGAYTQIASWDPGPNGIQSTPEDGSILQISIYQWEPTQDLDARLNLRRDNFSGSGNSILEEEQLTLGGVRVVRLKIQLTDGSQVLVYLAELGDRYLELSGSGDLATLDASMQSLRIAAAAP